MTMIEVFDNATDKSDLLISDYEFKKAMGCHKLPNYMLQSIVDAYNEKSSNKYCKIKKIRKVS